MTWKIKKNSKNQGNKNWFFEKLYKIYKALAKLTKKRRRKAQINMRWKNDVTKNANEI
jgi:hypothetical protein